MTTSSQEVAQIAVTALTEAREHAYTMKVAHENEAKRLGELMDQLQADISKYGGQGQ